MYCKDCKEIKIKDHKDGFGLIWELECKRYKIGRNPFSDACIHIDPAEPRVSEAPPMNKGYEGNFEW